MSTILNTILRSMKTIKSRRFQSFSSYSEYTVDEIQIPIPNGHLAGKLWKSKQQDEQSSSIPILAQHGWLDNAGTFDPLIPLIMKPNMTVFAFDYPGHGLSSHSSHMYYDGHFEGIIALSRVLRHFNWEKVTFLGHSLGAVISFIYSAAFPQHVHQYIAIDMKGPVVKYDYITSLQKITNVVSKIEAKIATGNIHTAYTYDEILKKTYNGRKGTVTEEGCKVLLKRGSVKLGENKYAFSHDIKVVVPTLLGKLSKEQVNKMTEIIKCPCCIIKGDPGKHLETISDFVDALDILKKSSKRVEFHLVPGTHHFHLNDPHLVAPIINKFLVES